MSKKHNHALVIGGSMAGLFAARVLSDHFERVTVVERDPLPDAAETRKGVPQARHAHGLLARGEEILSSLFPEIVPELVAAGAVRLDWARDVKWFHHGAWKARCVSGVMTTSLSRALLEQHVRRRVFALSNVQLMAAHDVVSLVADSKHNRITGVTVQRRAAGGEHAAAELLPADLVVDASGRGSRAPTWLEMLGYSAPEESTVRVHVGYASRIYRVPPGSTHDWKALYLVGTPPRDKRMGVISPLEGERWVVTLAGMLQDHPATDPDGYLEFARSLPTEDIYRTIRDAEPLSEIAAYKFPSNQRRHYERMKRAPECFIVIGDASCSFNPIYGQGMTTAGLGALTLAAALRDAQDLHGLAHHYHTELAAITEVPWAMATGEDLRYPEIEGKRPLGNALLQRYMSRLHVASARDVSVLLEFTRAMHMLSPPSALFKPGMMLRVLRAS